MRPPRDASHPYQRAGMRDAPTMGPQGRSHTRTELRFGGRASRAVVPWLRARGRSGGASGAEVSSRADCITQEEEEKRRTGGKRERGVGGLGGVWGWNRS